MLYVSRMTALDLAQVYDVQVCVLCEHRWSIDRGDIVNCPECDGYSDCVASFRITATYMSREGVMEVTWEEVDE